MTKTGARGAAIRMDKVRFSYGDASMQFDFSIEAGQIIAIVGPSGSGKSTLLNLIAGFESSQTGQVIIADQDVTHLPPSRRPISMVFQDNNLFAHLDVEANVGLGRSPNLRLSENDRTAVGKAIERVGLSGKEKRKPEALSGGERQRVAIARALVRNQPVLLLDEAFGSLGPALRQQMLELIRDLQTETGMTVLMVTHNPGDALQLDADLFFLENGTISATGPARELLSKTGPVALRQYLGSQITSF
ncbi:MAG: ATP-binding cassette domain-containing protein [Phyllobacterium sp.]